MTQKQAFLAIMLLVGTVITSAHAQTHQAPSPTPPPPVRASSAPLTNKDILELWKAHLSADVIIAKIEAAPCNFDTSPTALKDLKSAEVPDAVILAMVRSPVSNKPAPRAPEDGKILWISKFACQPQAAAAVATVQEGDLAALRQSSLFDGVTSFATDSQQPEGTWRLSANEVSYARGSAAVRAQIGLGTGRAHLVMAYELRDPSGAVVWMQEIKTQPSAWTSSGETGGIQDQGPATSDQPVKLVDALSKFFASRRAQPPNPSDSGTAQ